MAVLGEEEKLLERGKLFTKAMAVCCKQKYATGVYTSGVVFEPRFYEGLAGAAWNTGGSDLDVYTLGVGGRYYFDKIGVYLGADVNVDRWDGGHDLDDTKFSFGLEAIDKCDRATNKNESYYHISY